MGTKKKILTAEELAAKKHQFEKRIGHRAFWSEHNGDTATAVYAITGRNIIIGCRVDLGKETPEVCEPLWP